MIFWQLAMIKYCRQDTEGVLCLPACLVHSNVTKRLGIILVISFNLDTTKCKLQVNFLATDKFTFASISSCKENN